MGTNPLQRYNKNLEYAREIVKLCIENALFSVFSVGEMTKNTTHSRMRVRCVVLTPSPWERAGERFISRPLQLLVQRQGER